MTLDKLEQQSDEKLAQEASQNEDAFYVLIERYETKLLRYIKRISGSSQENAEDVLQESFIKAYRYLNNFDTSMKFSSWIYRITHNEAISYWRKIKKEKGNVNIEEEETGLLNVIASGEKADKEAVSKEIQIKIKEALREMPENYREILILRFLEEKEYEEIADILQKPVGTVSAMIHRAKTKFKDIGLKTNLDKLI